MSVLNEATDIVKERQESYGSPSPHWNAVAKSWSLYLQEAGLLRGEISGRQACELMIMLKCFRGAAKHKHDNHLDIAGYVWCAERCADDEKNKTKVG